MTNEYIDRPDASGIHYLNTPPEREELFGEIGVPRHCGYGGVIICLNGEAELSLDTKSYILGKGELCVIFPFTIVRTLRRSADFEVFGVMVGVELFKNIQIPSAMDYFMYIKDNPCIGLTDLEQKRIIELERFFVYKSRSQDHPFWQEIAGSLFRVIYFEIAAIYTNGSPSTEEHLSRKEMLVKRFMYLLAKNYQKHRNVNYYADKLFITPRYMSSVIKEKTGMNAITWISNMVIKQAKTLLEDKSLTIQQVADRLNFPNPSFFGQYFKKYTAMTPKNYRDSN